MFLWKKRINESLRDNIKNKQLSDGTIESEAGKGDIMLQQK